MKSQFPARPEQYAMRIKRIQDHCKKNSPMMTIPPIACMEMGLAMSSYFGGPWKMIWILFKRQIWLDWNDLICHVIIKLCDLAGWTKIYDVPATPDFKAYKIRHGIKCSGSPN